MRTYLPTNSTDYADSSVSEHANHLGSFRLSILTGFIAFIKSFFVTKLGIKEKRDLIASKITWNLIVKSVTLFLGTIWLLVIIITIF